MGGLNNRHMLLTGLLAFVLIGAAQALYGPAFPTFRARYGIGAAEVGLIVSLHFLGSFIGILLSGELIRKFGYRRTLGVSSLLLSLGLVGIAFSPSWAVALTAALLTGLGFGGVDVGMNVLVAQSLGSKGAPAINLLNAMFGVGAVLGPLLIAVFLPSIVWPFALAAAVAALVALLAFRLEEPPPPPTQADDARSLSKLFGFIFLYFLYVAAEVGVASWETSYLSPEYGESRAAFFTSLYWGAITLGRFIATPLSMVVSARGLVLGASALGLLGMVFTQYPDAAPYAFAVVGLAFAPIFPTALIWLHQVFPRRAERYMSIVIAAANLGAVASPPLIGLAVARGGPSLVPVSLILIVALLFAMTTFLFFRSRS